MSPQSQNNEELEKAILELNQALLRNPDDYTLFYERGSVFYALEKHEEAEADYIKAVSMGLDCTKYPYYTYLNFYSDSYRYSLRDKIILTLFALFFIAILALEVFHFLYRLKLHIG